MQNDERKESDYHPVTEAILNLSAGLPIVNGIFIEIYKRFTPIFDDCTSVQAEETIRDILKSHRITIPPKIDYAYWDTKEGHAVFDQLIDLANKLLDPAAQHRLN